MTLLAVFQFLNGVSQNFPKTLAGLVRSRFYRLLAVQQAISSTAIVYASIFYDFSIPSIRKQPPYSDHWRFRNRCFLHFFRQGLENAIAAFGFW